MADLPKEWKALIRATDWDNAEQLVERCYALYNQPPKELTDAEIDAINDAEFCDFPLRDEAVRMQERRACRAVIAAHIAKQREPEVVEFRAARHDSGQIDLLPYDPVKPMYPCYSWLDHDGKPQTFKVVLS